MKPRITNNSLYNKLTVMYSDRPEFIKLTVNLFPIFGVLFLNWDYYLIIMTYIAETFVIGAINVLKILKARGEIKNKKDWTSNNNASDTQENTRKIRVRIALFFIFHFNMFVLIQTIFVSVNSTFKHSHSFDSDFRLGILFFAISHFYSYRKNYVKKKQYLKTSPDVMMFSPYKRVVIQQLTILFGGFLLSYFNSPVFMIIIFVLLKMIFDIIMHKVILENKKK